MSKNEMYIIAWEAKHDIFVQQNVIIKEGEMYRNFGLDNVDVTKWMEVTRGIIKCYTSNEERTKKTERN